MTLKHFNEKFFSFLDESPTPFHAAGSLADILREEGFQRLSEGDQWQTKAGNGYYIVRDGGSFLAFRLAQDSWQTSPWRMAGAHTDSPALQIKPMPLRCGSTYTQLGVEVYGGPLLNTWFDRDLSIAGRVTFSDDQDTIRTRVINFKKPIVIIPSLAIHLDREANKDHTVERQKHLLPLLCQSVDDSTSFAGILQEQLLLEYPEITIKEILNFDLFCYDPQKPAHTGLAGEFISAGRLDNLVSCFSGARALMEKETADNCLLLCSNHEEIGSSSAAGARGNFLTSVLERLLSDSDLRRQTLHRSFFISMDNAHGLHPNFPEKHDPQHLPLLNHGPVIKYNSNQRYATTGPSAAFYKFLAKEIGIPTQDFVMNNDLPCGSTIGPTTASSLGVATVDVGVPSLSMHSIRETVGTEDPYMLFKTIAHYYSRPQLPLIAE
jgi:aspartyl aminopeptidase